MWSKAEQAILWAITYSPLLLIMTFRFVAGNDYFGINDWLNSLRWVQEDSVFFSKMAAEFYFVILVLIYTLVIFNLTIKFFFSGYEEKLKPGGEGEGIYIRKAEKLSANDYSFFLLTLLLPLISLDHSSVINLSVSILILFFVISIYVKTDAISVCPILFFSGRIVYKGVISYGEKKDEEKNSSLRKEAVMIIKKEHMNFHSKVRGVELVKGVFYISSNN